VVLLYSNDHDASDPSLKGPDGMMEVLNSMKESHHIVPEMLLDGQTKAASLMDRALIIIGPNTRANNGDVDPAFGMLPVPIIVSKDGTNYMNLGARVGGTDPPDDDSIVIVNADHPLAAGFKAGKLKVMTTADRQRMIFFTNIGPDAIKIANSQNNANEWSLFAYEKGKTMANNAKAPAKRVGFFWHRPAGANDDGKKLFRAAIEWALRP
jgi:hypothetical protein